MILRRRWRVKGTVLVSVVVAVGNNICMTRDNSMGSSLAEGILMGMGNMFKKIEIIR